MLLVMLYPFKYVLYATSLRSQHARVDLMARYLNGAAPDNAVFICSLQCGSLAMSTRRPVVRWDAVAGDKLDSTIDELSARGYAPAFVLDERMELPGFRARFSGQTFSSLDWGVRATAEDAGGSMMYWVLADRGGPSIRTRDVISAR